MRRPLKKTDSNFIVATLGRSVCDENARALEKHGLLRFIALGTRRGISGVPPEHTRLKPSLGGLAYIASKLLPSHQSESFRFGLHPQFDHWVKKQLSRGDNILSTYGCTNDSFAWVRANGGKTFLDAGNSHPENFWDLLTEEHQRWNYQRSPIAEHHHRRSLAMLQSVDYVLSPSSYVTETFLARGFRKEQILKNVYPVDLSTFRPRTTARPKNQPLTLINTGTLSLRKGTPYLLEAFRIIHSRHPSSQLLLTNSIQDSVKTILPRYANLPIQWAPPLPHTQLAERLRSADIFVLPSLEEGLVRTACEAMACGLPAILTPHTGANDFVQPGVNGEIIPIRDPQAIAEAVLKWSDIIMRSEYRPAVNINSEPLTLNYFESCFLQQLKVIGIG